jgi:hypothetical protein
MYITDGDGQGRFHDTDPVNFTLASDDVYEQYIENLLDQQRELHHLTQDESILEWAERQGDPHVVTDNKTHLPDPLSDSSIRDLMLVIGIKTAVLTNFPRRQAIRETWASKSNLPPDVKVLFLGCTPNTTSIPSARDRRRFEKAVDLERAIYGDLLTDELECDDAYHKLADKVKAYFEFAAAELPRARFVALADDDIYVRVDSLTAYLRERNPHRQYIGEVWRTRLSTKERPIRDPKLPNYLSFDVYSLHEYPPYPIGACYVVSMDAARFIAKNRWRLRSRKWHRRCQYSFLVAFYPSSSTVGTSIPYASNWNVPGYGHIDGRVFTFWNSSCSRKSSSQVEPLPWVCSISVAVECSQFCVSNTEPVPADGEQLSKGAISATN